LLKAIDHAGEFERFGDEGTAVSQEDVLELQGDPAERGGARDLLQDAETQTEARVVSEIGIAVQTKATLEWAMTVRMPFIRLREIEDFVDQRQG
jgi:hypothetical protein